MFTEDSPSGATPTGQHGGRSLFPKGVAHICYIICRSGKVSPVSFYEISTPMAEEIKSITSSIVTHTEKLWVTATQAPPRAAQESTFTADGKSG